MKKSVKILIFALVVVVVIFSGFIVWSETPPAPMPESYDALQSTENVIVLQRQWLIFEPKSTNFTTGFIFYPGGRVNYVSYAPYAHAIADDGYLVVVVRMPLNLAVFGANIASDIIAAYPNITLWAIGGHSLGGSMAAQYARDNPDKIAGLVLWASYPASGTDLSGQDLAVLTIRGSNDGLVSSSQIDDSLKQLPHNTVYVELSGGNHAQFGWYGEQTGDNPASISREQQQSQTVESTVSLLASLGE